MAVTNRTEEVEYRFERFTPDQLPQLHSLHRAVFGSGSSEEKLRQKFASPVPGRAVIGYLAYAPDGTAAAYYGIFPMIVEHQGQTLIVGQSGETMTHPDHRGRGLFTKLGRRTYDAAGQEGVAFVFGFPNSNSYPGFVKYLGWTHNRTMRSYWLPVPTIPFNRLLRGRPSIADRLDRFQKRLILALGLARPTDEIESSVLASGQSGIKRDRAFVDHKPTILTFEQSRATAYFRLDEHLSIGDVVAEPGAKPFGLLIRLGAIAFLTGRLRIRFHASPGTAADRFLRGRMPVKEGLPYGHVSFDDEVDPELFDFTFIDYDTF